MHSAVLVCVSAVGCHHKTRIQNSMMHCFLSSALTCIYAYIKKLSWLLIYKRCRGGHFLCLFFTPRLLSVQKSDISTHFLLLGRIYTRSMLVHRMLHNDYEDTISAFFLPVRFLRVRTARFIVGAHIDRSGLYENLIIKFHRSIFYTFSRATRVCIFFLEPFAARAPCMKHKFRPQQY